jgi:hypothetical protein
VGVAAGRIVHLQGSPAGGLGYAEKPPFRCEQRVLQNSVLMALPVPISKRRLVELAGREAREIFLEVDRPGAF